MAPTPPAWHVKVFWLAPATTSADAATALMASVETWLNGLPKCEPTLSLTFGEPGTNFRNAVIVAVRES